MCQLRLVVFIYTYVRFVKTERKLRQSNIFIHEKSTTKNQYFLLNYMSLRKSMLNDFKCYGQACDT